MYFKTIGRKRRDHFSILSHFILYFFMIPRNLPFASCLKHLLTIVPAVICGCSGEMPHEVPLYKSHSISFSPEQNDLAKGGTLDIFAFETDRLRRLDSYQRIETFIGGKVRIASCGGEKALFLCADSRRNRYEWSDISSYNSLTGISCELEHESITRRTMTGECIVNAGETSATVTLMPLTCEIILKAICCDFSGTPYSESVIKNVKAYMTNVSASCPLLYSDSVTSTRIINQGMLCQTDISKFRHMEIITREIAEEVGRETIHTDARFLCYPNTPKEDSPGSPFTRLVIEGVIGSHTYYWPITINAPTGVERGCRYVYDVFIRRKGVTDPDIPIEPSSIELNMKIRSWNEKEEYSVGF